MWSILLVTSLFLLNIQSNWGCRIRFSKLDETNTVRGVYEKDVFNITGRLRNCPAFLTVQNVSIGNSAIRRVSVLNVTYVIETNSINIIGFARLIGFAPLTIQLYFQNPNEYQANQYAVDNTKRGKKACSESSNNQLEISENCPRLKFEDNHYILTEEISVAIKRHQTIIDALFTAVVTFLVTIGTLCIGCDLEIEQLVQNLKRPIPMIIGLLCQIIYLPLLSVLLSKILRLEESTGLGLLSTASCPGGSSSNIYTAILSGDVDLSVIMTFITTILSFGTFPLWIWLLGSDYVDFTKTKFPWWSMFLSLMTIFIPAITGLLFRRYRPVLAYRIGRFLNPIAVGYLVFILTFGVYINMYIFSIIDFRSILACCFLPWFGFVGGAILSFIGVREKKKNIAICIETGVQNTAVAILFLRLSFPQPEADIALANPILVSMTIPAPFLVLFFTRALVNRYPCLQKLLPKKKQKKAIENGVKLESPEKTIRKELLEEKEKEKEESAQLEKPSNISV